MYVIEYRDTRERWHRPRLPTYHSAMFAIRQGDKLARTAYPRATGFRVVNTETRKVEFQEALY
jgi:hypothetical protein